MLSRKIILFFLVFCCFEVSASEVLVDRLIAEVNGEPVVYSEVLEKVNRGPLVAVAPYPAKQSDAPFDVALQDIINFKLVMQKAKELEIGVSDDRLEAEIEKFATRKNVTYENLKSIITRQGVSFESYKEDFRSQMILSQFQGRVILPAVKISEKDIELYYLKISGSVADNVKLLLRNIFIEIPSKAVASVKNGKKKLAERVYGELKDGLEFGEAVKIYSGGSNVDKQGLMPPLFLKDLAPKFQFAIEPLQEGEFTRPIQTSQGYYIFFLEQRSFAGSVDFQKRKKELEFQLRKEEMERQTIKWIRDQRRQSKIRIIKD